MSRRNREPPCCVHNGVAGPIQRRHEEVQDKRQRQTDRGAPTDRQTDRQTNRQIEGHRQTDRDRDGDGDGKTLEGEAGGVEI